MDFQSTLVVLAFDEKRGYFIVFWKMNLTLSRDRKS